MIKELPEDWTTVNIPKNIPGEECKQWLLHNNVTHVIGFGRIAIKHEVDALAFKLKFGYKLKA